MSRLLFRSHAELEPSGKVSILGRTLCSAERMQTYAARRNPGAPLLAALYLETSAQYGIRADVAFCQAMYDTRTWTADIRSARNPTVCQLIWSPAGSADSDAGLARKVQLHLRLLHTFATREQPDDNDDWAKLVSPGDSMQPSWRGGTICWEDLDGKWALPGNRYGQDIVALWRNMKEWRGEGDPLTDREVESPAVKPDERETASAAATAVGQAMQWMHSRALLPSPPPHPARGVTWGELAVLLRKWESDGS